MRRRKRRAAAPLRNAGGPAIPARRALWHAHQSVSVTLKLLSQRHAPVTVTSTASTTKVHSRRSVRLVFQKSRVNWMGSALKPGTRSVKRPAPPAPAMATRGGHGSHRHQQVSAVELSNYYCCRRSCVHACATALFVFDIGVGRHLLTSLRSSGWTCSRCVTRWQQLRATLRPRLLEIASVRAQRSAQVARVT